MEWLVKLDAVACGVGARRVRVQCLAPPPPARSREAVMMTDADTGNNTSKPTRFEDSDEIKWVITYVQSF